MRDLRGPSADHVPADPAQQIYSARDRFQVRGVPAMPKSAPARLDVVDVEPTRNLTLGQLVGDPVNTLAPAVEVGVAVSTMVKGARP
jgi:hypothetical protein